VLVKYAPHGNTNATAELAILLMLSISRNFHRAIFDLKMGIWQRKQFQGFELYGKILGVLGCGRVGQKTAEIGDGLGMRITGYDLYPQENANIEYISLDDLLKRSDYISIHAATDQVIIGERELSLMKPSAYLINTSRGHVVDEDALYQALLTNQIKGAALDTFRNEPDSDGQMFENKLLTLDNFVGTPHLSASTMEAQRKTGIEIAQVVVNYLLWGNFDNSVNASEDVVRAGRDLYRLYLTIDDVPGVFGSIDTLLGDNNINIKETPTRKMGDRNQSVYLLHQQPGTEVIEALKKLPGVHSVKF